MAEHPSLRTEQQPAPGDGPSALLLALLDMGRQARMASTTDELGFMLVNGSHALVPYRQAALWWQDSGVQALSGVVQPDRNAPYVGWLNALLQSATPAPEPAKRLVAADLPPELAQQWAEWLPAQALVIALPGQPSGALLLARDFEWADQEVALLQEWCHTWLHAWRARTASSSARSWPQWRHWRRWLGLEGEASTLPWHKRKAIWLAAAAVLILLLPVRTSVLASGEVVPAQPVVVRAPIEGVIAQFDVQPNTEVQQNQPLFSFDAALIETRVNVARQALETALAQYRQTSQLALSDPKYKIELAAQAGGIEEKRSEYDYLKEQKLRAQVRSPAAGVVLFDDPSTWIGKPVAVGERILRIARTGDIEVEAWLPVADAIELREGDPVTLYLQAHPLSPVEARLHYFSHEAVQRPDGGYAYRVRARIEEGQAPRVGLKGTARISGRWTPLSYWLLRRPLAAIRTTLGL